MVRCAFKQAIQPVGKPIKQVSLEKNIAVLVSGRRLQEGATSKYSPKKRRFQYTGFTLELIFLSIHIIRKTETLETA